MIVDLTLTLFEKQIREEQKLREPVMWFSPGHVPQTWQIANRRREAYYKAKGQAIKRDTLILGKLDVGPDS